MIAWNGNISNGELPFKASDEFINVLEPIMLGNTTEIQENVSANRFLNQITKDVPIVVGSQVPVKRFNVRFTEAGFSSDSYEFTKNIQNFDFEQEDFKIRLASFTFEQMIHAENYPEGMESILEEEQWKMEEVMRFYTNRYLVDMRAIALITGTSLSLTVPAVNAGGAYTDNLGALRGEDMTDIPPSTATDATERYHYRAKVGATLASSDIFTCKKMIEEYTTYSGAGVLAVGNATTLFDMREILSSNEVKDNTLPLEVPVSEIAGVKFTELNIIPDGKILFMDAGVAGDLLINAVNKAETQRGIAIINEVAKVFESLSDYNNTSMYIWKHGYHVFQREKLLWLDINTADATGKMSATGITEMETWAKSLRKGITDKDYIL